jgi:GNAT superfamily N-acetyltransferase
MDVKDWIRHAVADDTRALDPEPEQDGDDTASYLIRNNESGVAVREATLGDALAIAAVGSRSFRHAHAAVLHPVDLAGVVSRFDEPEVRKELADPDSRWLVALWAGETVGFAQIRTATLPTNLLGRFPIELHGIFVAPDWSGQGVGRTLIEASSKLALSLGYESLWVRVFAANRAAIAFLEGLKFECVHWDVAVGRKSSATIWTLSRSLTATA